MCCQVGINGRSKAEQSKALKMKNRRWYMTNKVVGEGLS